MAKVTIINETKATLPRVAFDEIKGAVLGKAYILNVIVTSAAGMEKLNSIYRNKEEPTDILSFPLSKKEGEMYLCLPEARKEAKKFGRSYENFLSFLFIHGCVHLKGHDHGATMESIEAKLRTRFGI